uniref:HEAT repeat-containing protein 1 n=1 Tax=Salmo trutta TaxID=8032 RepID=A0A674BM97_SALTR
MLKVKKVDFGCTGLEELLSIDQASVGLERGVQSKEVNEKPDAGISLFLTRLSPYFLLKSAQKKSDNHIQATALCSEG